jgi:hypothetical protein
MKVPGSDHHYELTPAGTHVATLVAVKNPGLVTDQSGERNLWRLAWVLSVRDSQGRYHRAFQRVTPSLHKESTAFTQGGSRWPFKGPSTS